MSTAKDIADELINRMKNTSLQKFEIKREVGENWIPNGVVPFDIYATNGVATFTVWAESYIDAEDQITQYLEQDDE
jgi:hypothetical protein